MSIRQRQVRLPIRNQTQFASLPHPFARAANSPLFVLDNSRDSAGASDQEPEWKRA